MSKYKRNGRSPVPQSEAVSRVMSANRGRGTGPELQLRRALREAGAPGYRLHWKKAPGRPDISYPGKKIAILIHGCFWHRCPYCSLPVPKSHTDFWEKKFERNVRRDARNLDNLRVMGWKVLVVWECEIKSDVGEVVRRISDALSGSNED